MERGFGGMRVMRGGLGIGEMRGLKKFCSLVEIFGQGLCLDVKDNGNLYSVTFLF